MHSSELSPVKKSPKATPVAMFPAVALRTVSPPVTTATTTSPMTSATKATATTVATPGVVDISKVTTAQFAATVATPSVRPSEHSFSEFESPELCVTTPSTVASTSTRATPQINHTSPLSTLVVSQSTELKAVPDASRESDAAEASLEAVDGGVDDSITHEPMNYEPIETDLTAEEAVAPSEKDMQEPENTPMAEELEAVPDKPARGKTTKERAHDTRASSLPEDKPTKRQLRPRSKSPSEVTTSKSAPRPKKQATRKSTRKPRGYSTSDSAMSSLCVGNNCLNHTMF